MEPARGCPCRQAHVRCIWWRFCSWHHGGGLGKSSKAGQRRVWGAGSGLILGEKMTFRECAAEARARASGGVVRSVAELLRAKKRVTFPQKSHLGSTVGCFQFIFVFDFSSSAHLKTTVLKSARLHPSLTQISFIFAAFCIVNKPWVSFPPNSDFFGKGGQFRLQQLI